MKKGRTIKTIVGSALFSLACLSLAASISARGSFGVSAAGGSYSVPLDGYYDSITASYGTQLMGQVHDLMAKTHKTYTTYDDNGRNGLQKQTDYDPNDPNKIIEWYSGMPMDNAWNPVTGGYNREHVWCQSLSNGLWGEKGGGADMHHLRPVEVTLNTARNNSPYGIVPNRDSYKKYPKNVNKQSVTDWCGGYKNNDIFEPIDSKKGDVARVLMYTYVHYSTYANVGGTTNGTGSSAFFGTLSITSIVSAGSEKDAWNLLLDWNKSDPVDILETNRNEAVAHLQGNRNPFIDHPEYAEAIWGEQPEPVTSEPSSEPAPSSSASQSSSESGKKGGCGGSVESTIGAVSFGVLGLFFVVFFGMVRTAKNKH